MAVKISRRKTQISKQVLVELEESVGYRLPPDYRGFLLEYNGGTPETNEFDIPQVFRNSSGVNEFLSIGEMIAQKARLGNRLTEDVWPIAYAEGGNLVCITLGDDSGNIYFWDHELEADESELPSRKNMFLLAPTFEHFWQMLKKFDPSQVTLRPDQVIRTWVNPNPLKPMDSE